MITSAALLTPLFQSLDKYFWYPVNFTHTLLKALSSSKSKETYSKPGYLHVAIHITELLPILSDESAETMEISTSQNDTKTSEEPKESAPTATPKEIEMTSVEPSPRDVMVVCNILAVGVSRGVSCSAHSDFSRTSVPSRSCTCNRWWMFS